MKAAIAKYIEYLRSVRNASPHTVVNYESDLQQFGAFLMPPGTPEPSFSSIDHRVLREFTRHLHDLGSQKSSIAPKLAAIRALVNHCGRMSMREDNSARLVAMRTVPQRH